MTNPDVPSYRRIPQPLFKFLPEKYAIGLVERGSIRIGTAHDFRKVEQHNRARGDPSEATPGSVALVDDLELRPDTPGPRYLADVIRAEVPSRIQGLIVEKIESDQDYYIYCVTGQHQAYFYDAFEASACVRIRDVRGFVNCLAVHLFPISQAYDFARVSYGQRFGPLSEAHDRPPPFVKPHHYAWQDELRLVWVPTPGPSIQPFNTDVPGLRDFCELVPRRQIPHD
jgi:hypothetical protein